MPFEFVEALEWLPPELAEFYADESQELKGGEVDPTILADLDARYRRVVGPKAEWVRYLNLGDIQCMWVWLPPEEVLCYSAVAAVPKKNGRRLNILAVVPKNSGCGPPRRSQGLGLTGGDALGRVLAPFGVHAGCMDLENAFSYVSWMPWVWTN